MVGCSATHDRTQFADYFREFVLDLRGKVESAYFNYVLVARGFKIEFFDRDLLKRAISVG